jgi:hypothetical protein
LKGAARRRAMRALRPFAGGCAIVGADSAPENQGHVRGEDNAFGGCVAADEISFVVAEGRLHDGVSGREVREASAA